MLSIELLLPTYIELDCGSVGDFLRPRTWILGLRAGMIGVRYVDDKSTCVDRENTAVLRKKIHSRGELSL